MTLFTIRLSHFVSPVRIELFLLAFVNSSVETPCKNKGLLFIASDNSLRVFRLSGAPPTISVTTALTASFNCDCSIFLFNDVLIVCKSSTNPLICDSSKTILETATLSTLPNPIIVLSILLITCSA